MTEYESRKIIGWRRKLDDALAEKRCLVWGTPVTVVYVKTSPSQGSENFPEHSHQIRRVYGPEKNTRSEELRQLRRVSASIRRAELTPEQRHQKSTQDRARYAKLTPDQKQKRIEKARARRAALTEEHRERVRAKLRKWRSEQGADWHEKEAMMKRLRRLAKPELYREIDRRSKERAKARRAAQKTP